MDNTHTNTHKNSNSNTHKNLNTKDSQDRSLQFLTDLLLDVHRKYYQEDVEDVRDILQDLKGIFRGRKIFLEEDGLYLAGLVRMYGGEVVRNIEDSDLVYRVSQDSPTGWDGRGIPVVSVHHLYQSIYSLRLLDLDGFILGGIILGDSDSLDSLILDIEDDLFRNSN